MKILVCDDDQAFRDQMVTWITTYFDNQDVEVVSIGSLQALDACLAHPPHLLFQDIRLPDGNGLEAMATWRKRCPTTDLVYMTNFEADVVAVANTRPFAFIDKAKVLEEVRSDLFGILDRWQACYQAEKAFVYQTSGTMVSLLHRDIISFEKKKRKVIPHTVYGEKPAFYASMNEIVDQLKDPDFILVNQSFIVNCNYVERFRRDRVFLRNGIDLSISQSYRKVAQEKMVAYFKARMDGHD